MGKKPEVPKDIGLKVGSKREAFLTKVQDMMYAEKEDCKRTIDLNNVILKALEGEIVKEKENFK